MSSHTVIASTAVNSALIMDTVFDATDAEAAVEAFCKKRELAREQLLDVIVLLGLTGSTLLHASKKVASEHRSYTQDELQAAFDLVKDKEHWKNPVNAVLFRPTEEQLKVIGEAVSHFTGSIAEFQRLKGGKVRVTAVGYFATIGG